MSSHYYIRKAEFESSLILGHKQSFRITTGLYSQDFPCLGSPMHNDAIENLYHSNSSTHLISNATNQNTYIRSRETLQSVPITCTLYSQDFDWCATWLAAYSSHYSLDVYRKMLAWDMFMWQLALCCFVTRRHVTRIVQ